MNDYEEALKLLRDMFDEFPDKILTLGPDRVNGQFVWAVYDVCKPNESIALHENPLQAVQLAIGKLWKKDPKILIVNLCVKRRN